MAYQLLIDGALVDGASTLDVIDPASGAVFETCARADEAQLEQAIAAAKRAFPGWAARPHAERREYLGKLADAMQERFDEFCKLLTREQKAGLHSVLQNLLPALNAYLRSLGAHGSS